MNRSIRFHNSLLSEVAMVCQYWISLARPFHRRERLASQLNPAHVLTFFRRRLPAA